MGLRLLQVILLDTRYHRDPLFSDGSIVGSLQWEWLAKELKGPATAITIIGSSIQVDILKIFLSSVMLDYASLLLCWFLVRYDATSSDVGSI